TRFSRDWSSDVCSSDLGGRVVESAVWAATRSRARGMRAAGWSGRIIVVLVVAGGILIPLSQTGELSIFGVLIVIMIATMLWQARSEERRVGKESRSQSR